MAPRLREHTNQAMANDLLSVQEERYKYSYTGNNNQTLSKEVLLNDTDPLYRRIKHMHIAELSTQLHTEYKRFLESNKNSAALSKGNANDVRAMAEGEPWHWLPCAPSLQGRTCSLLLPQRRSYPPVPLTTGPNPNPEPDQVRAMAEGLKAMPKFQEETARYSLHIHVVGELLKKFNESCLEEVRSK